MGDHGMPDDVDRLFLRLEAPPLPAAFLDRTVALAAERRRRRRELAAALAGYALLLLAVAASAFGVGRGLVAGGAADILALALAAPAAVGNAPRDFLWALAESLPWGWLLALVVVGGALARWVGPVAAVAATPRRELEARRG